ncbi:MAG: group I truncated hemoglobin, partial [Longimicrobiales bacterium]
MSAHNPTLYVSIALIALVAGLPGSAVAQSDSAQEEQQSLYERLGGLAPISVVVNDFIDILVQDAVLNANPAIDAARR